MKMIKKTRRYFIGILFLLTGVVSCATVPELNVNYRLPPESEELKGKKVFFGFEDVRKSKDLIGEGAREAFKNFSGNISFSLARGDEPGFKMGVYDIPSLFREVFEKRLEYSGVEVVSDRTESEIEMVIVLKDFLLDLIDRKWTVTMAYEARVRKDGEVLASQMISGEAERLKLVGRGDADKVMGEIFTDLVNRLDVARLFQQARLL